MSFFGSRCLFLVADEFFWFLIHGTYIYPCMTSVQEQCADACRPKMALFVHCFADSWLTCQRAIFWSGGIILEKTKISIPSFRQPPLVNKNRPTFLGYMSWCLLPNRCVFGIPVINFDIFAKPSGIQLLIAKLPAPMLPFYALSTQT